MIKIGGVVTKRTGVFPELRDVYYRCVCGDVKGPFLINLESEVKINIGTCVMCHSSGPYVIDDVKTIYRNY